MLPPLGGLLEFEPCGVVDGWVLPGGVVWGCVVPGVVVLGAPLGEVDPGTVVEPGVAFGEVLPGAVVLGAPFGDVDGVVAPGEVEPGAVGAAFGEVDPGVVAFGDVPFGEVEPGVLCVPDGGVAVPAGGVAVPGAGVAAPGVAVCPAVPEPPAGAVPPEGEVCAVTHTAQNRITESVVMFFVDVMFPSSFLCLCHVLVLFSPQGRLEYLGLSMERDIQPNPTSGRKARVVSGCLGTRSRRLQI